MANDNRKRQWLTPQLTVLFRSTTEETVLFACKNKEVHGKGGPNDNSVCANPGQSDSAWCWQAVTS